MPRYEVVIRSYIDRPTTVEANSEEEAHTRALEFANDWLSLYIKDETQWMVVEGLTKQHEVPLDFDYLSWLDRANEYDHKAYTLHRRDD